MRSQSPARLPADERWKLGPMTVAEVLRNRAAIMDFVDTSRAIALNRTQAYELARRGDFPIPLLRFGRSWKARRVDVLAYLGIERAQGGDAA